MERQILHHFYYQAKEMLQRGDKDKSREYCDKGIVLVATQKQHGAKHDDLIEGIKVDLWIERFWGFRENNGLSL